MVGAAELTAADSLRRCFVEALAIAGCEPPEMAETAARRDLGDQHAARCLEQGLPGLVETQIAQIFERRLADEAAEMLLQGTTRHAAGCRDLADGPGPSHVGLDEIKRLSQVARMHVPNHAPSQARRDA